MSVDKAFKEITSGMLYSEDFGVSKEHRDINARMRRTWFEIGYTACQKTLSPEVREAVKTLIRDSDTQKYFGFYECKYCGCFRDPMNKVLTNHEEKCPIGTIEKLLEEGE